jgi:hypothetical protein
MDNVENKENGKIKPSPKTDNNYMLNPETQYISSWLSLNSCIYCKHTWSAPNIATTRMCQKV